MSKTETQTSRKDRRLYPYKGTVLVCFGGGHFAPAEGVESAFNFAHPATKIEFVDAHEDASIKVTQRLKGKKGVVETWHRLVA